jgi:hypothetical protein
LNFAPPWQVNQEARQSALEHSVQVFAEGTGTNLAMSFMSSWERKVNTIAAPHPSRARLHFPSDCARGGGAAAFIALERRRGRQ